MSKRQRSTAKVAAELTPGGANGVAGLVRPDGPGMYLFWEGRRSYRTSMPAPRVLEPVPELSFGENSDNLIIEGDNLQAMVSLRSQYRGTVNVVYIDPPYNTGKRDFRYSDRRFHDPDADDSSAVYVTNEDGGRHTKWLNYMAPRLSLVHELLADDGICLVSINDVELFRVGLLLDEIFGEDNRLGLVVWKQAADNNPTRIAVGHEYILCYAKREEDIPQVWLGDSPGKDWLMSTYRSLKKQHGDDITTLQSEYQDAIKKHLAAYNEELSEKGETELVNLAGLERYDLVDERGPYAANRTTENPRVSGYWYEVRNPKTGKVHKQPGNGYRFPEETMRRYQAENRVIYPDDPRRLVQLKKYLIEIRPPLRGIIDIGSRGGVADLKRLLGKNVYPNPKPTKLLELLLSFAGDSNALVLDAWAGSGTTAHAVLRLNLADNGTRRFILIEEGAPEDRFCRTVTAPRVKAAIEQEGLPGGFVFERIGRRMDREAILDLEREAIANLIAQTDATGTGRGIRRVAGAKYVIGTNSRGEGISLYWHGRATSTVTAEILTEMFTEADRLGVRRPLRVYASTCQVGETTSFRFCQIPDEILARLALDETDSDSTADSVESDNVEVG
jgi:adenine-specific DNA-methyltransferase